MSDLIDGGYIVAAILLILGLKSLAKPRTAVRGNQLAALGMLVAVAVTLTDEAIVSWPLLVAGLVIGGALGALLALRVQMTSMPELVALFNGFGGAASALVVVASFDVTSAPVRGDDTTYLVAAGLTALIGSTTLTGSVVAFVKLQERLGSVDGGAIRALNIVLAIGAAALVGAFVGADTWLVLVMVIALGSIVGVTGVLPIGGADMPVVIALLNSLSGLAAAASGFALGNSLLIVAGSLVGASGLILTQVMCVAMNRTLADVLFTAMAAGSGLDADDVYEGKIRSTSADEVAMMLDVADRVCIVPGYGLAVAQAQHAVHELASLLAQREIEVTFAIHPVAGRMPGHMNVLLAEAEIDYDALIEMDEANSTFATVDVAIVLGANDVVNPIARQPNSPIAGMPILDVDQARSVVVIKRSLSPGFAGIPNPLFAADNALMLFGDGKQAVADINTALADL